MKKILLLIGFIAFSGCGISDAEYMSKYTYINNTEWDLSVTVIIPSVDEQRKEEFTIEQGESHTLTFSQTGDQYPDPFSYIGGGVNYTVIVSNGIALVECKWSENCDLFDIDSYVIKPSKDGIRYAEYVFENSYFDNAVPIE